ncbi:hypothetical protein C6H69_13470 [Photorhabdus luminescens]|nr:hypothetical protein C6H69_13470 [Photorhabdus luminescens]
MKTPVLINLKMNVIHYYFGTTSALQHNATKQCHQTMPPNSATKKEDVKLTQKIWKLIITMFTINNNYLFVITSYSFSQSDNYLTLTSAHSKLIRKMLLFYEYFSVTERS